MGEKNRSPNIHKHGKNLVPACSGLKTAVGGFQCQQTAGLNFFQQTLIFSVARSGTSVRERLYGSQGQCVECWTHRY